MLRTRVLEQGDLLLEFTLGEPESFLWVISRAGFRIVSLPSRRTIETKTRSFLASVSSPPRSPTNPFERHLTLGRELFDLLLGPVRQDILEARHVIICPDGVLHNLPFESLVVTHQGSQSYLLEVAPLSYVPSASVLQELRERPRRRAYELEFLGVAQPNARVEDEAYVTPEDPSGVTMMPAIPFAVEEVESVASFYPAAKRRLYIGPEATEVAVKREDLGDFRIVHFATHAVADGLLPERSGILLTVDRSSKEDGVLRMAEIRRLSLSSELVVLSACQTGLGQVLSAEGTVGLSWAFLSAGTSSIVVSLWNVQDHSTSELMKAFYRRMQQGEDRAAALQWAKQPMLESERQAFRHPYNCAPFFLIGVAE